MGSRVKSSRREMVERQLRLRIVSFESHQVETIKHLASTYLKQTSCWDDLNRHFHVTADNGLVTLCRMLLAIGQIGDVLSFHLISSSEVIYVSFVSFVCFKFKWFKQFFEAVK